jgi:DnaK suppressor protein
VRVKHKFSKKDLDYFKKIIKKRRDELLDGLQHSLKDTLEKSPREAAGDISGYAFHMADLATDTYDREFSLGLASNEREILYEIDEALKKIEEARYGFCEECKSPISKRRLKAIPYTRLCLKCQEAKEKR